jgi:hypothetical protein
MLEKVSPEWAMLMTGGWDSWSRISPVGRERLHSETIDAKVQGGQKKKEEENVNLENFNDLVPENAIGIPGATELRMRRRTRRKRNRNGQQRRSDREKAPRKRTGSLAVVSGPRNYWRVQLIPQGNHRLYPESRLHQSRANPSTCRFAKKCTITLGIDGRTMMDSEIMSMFERDLSKLSFNICDPAKFIH